jgi:hypothetical protein
MGWIYSKCIGEVQECCLENLESRHHSADLDVEGRIVFRLIQ